MTIDGQIDSFICAVNNVAGTERAAWDPMKGTVRMAVSGWSWSCSFSRTEKNLRDLILESRNEGESEGKRRIWEE